MENRLNLIVVLLYVIGLLIVSGLQSILQAEAVFMKDGTLIEGKIIKENNLSLFIQPPVGATKEIQRSELLRILFNDDYKNKVYINNLDNSRVEGYIVYEDKDNYIIREDLKSIKEITLLKTKVNSISKKKDETIVKNKQDIKNTAEDGSLQFQKVYEVTGEKKELFNETLLWLTEKFQTNYKILLQDKEKLRISAIIISKSYHYYNFKFNMIYEFQDNKIRATIKNIKWGKWGNFEVEEYYWYELSKHDMWRIKNNSGELEDLNNGLIEHLKKIKEKW
jgi:hypothetical protein